MNAQVISLDCPGCGAPVATSDKICGYCDKPIIITSFSSIQDMTMPEVNKYAGAYRKILAENPDNMAINNSIGMCYLKLKLYDKALPAFEKAMEDNFENSETFFYAAVSVLAGKIAFLAKRPEIDKIQEYVNAAKMIEPKGIYDYFLAYIKYDYFKRKFLKISPTYEDDLRTARENGISPSEVNQLFEVLRVQKPDVL